MAKRKKKIIVAVILTLVILLLLVVGSGVGYVVTQYNKTYERVEIVKRPDIYVMPEYPELDETPPEEGEDDGTDFIEPEVIPPEVSEEPPEKTEDTTASVTQTPQKPSSSNKNQKPLSVYKKVPLYEVEQKNKDVLNILLLGTDSHDITSDMGRSDTMVVVSYNSKTGAVKLTSILRDSLVPIEGYDWNKINTAYFFGGVGLAINTVNQLFDLDIQKFAVIDMRSVNKFIKRIGGVDVKLTKAEADYYNGIYNTSLTAGVNHLNAQLVMAHMRNRKLDSDFGRTRRQRDVIVAVVNKLLSEKSLKEINRIVTYGTEMIRTNIDLTTMLSLASSVVSQKDTLKIESQTVPYSNAYRSTWYKRKAVLSFDIEDAAKKINEFIYGE